jgi:predicted phosphodiesterase
MLIAVCGGVYSNPGALRAFLDDARRRGAERLYCLGDLGGYGAEPEAVWPLLTESGVTCIAGNYDVAIGSGAEDCGCGFSDPRDNYFAQIMYDYTRRHTSAGYAGWMRELPTELREEHDGCTLHLVHGSTVGLNDYWWESLPESEHRRRVDASGADVIACTHSGLPWTKRVGRTLVVNVGVIGRPANDGDTHVWYALVELGDGLATAQLIRLAYDWETHARSLEKVGFPAAFATTTRTGWWTTCLEVLPIAERSRGRFHVYDSSVPSILSAAGLPESAWPQEDPTLPVRSLWTSPLMPPRIWHACSQSMPEFAEAARALGFEVGELRDAKDGAAPAGTRQLRLPELTLTAEGWFYRPDQLDEQPLLPAPRTAREAEAQVPAARVAATARLLSDLQRGGVLRPPTYCAG